MPEETKYFSRLPDYLVGENQLADVPGDGWTPFCYELKDFSGTGLYTGARSPAGEITLDLGLTGWQRISLAHNPAVRIRLEGETGYCELAGDPYAVREVSLPPLDFANCRRLQIAPVRSSAKSEPVTLFFLKSESCVPASGEDKKLIATNDGHDIFSFGVDRPEDLYRHLYPFRNSDFFRMVWGLYGGAIKTMNPNSEFGESPLYNDKLCYYEDDYRFCQSLQRFREMKIDPLNVVRQATREYGLELHLYSRMAAFYGPFPHLGWNSRFFTDNPQWHCRDEFGRKINFISYAYPQVQERLLAFYRELLEYDPDGICLAFNRGLPLMVCEEPVLAAYEKKYHRRPRLPEEADTPELLAVRHELLAEFVGRVSNLLEKHGKELSCIVPRNFEYNRLFGLDAELLARRGLVKTMMVGSGHRDQALSNYRIDEVKALQAPGVRIYLGGSDGGSPGMAWEPGNLQARATQMKNILDNGLDGGWFWDAEGAAGYDWKFIQQFGNASVLNRLIADSVQQPPVHETRAIHDLQVSRYNPNHAY